MSQQVQVTIPQILGYLDNGMSRKEIAEKLGISMSDCKRLFTDPRLKGKQAKQLPGFVIVEEDEVATAAPTQHYETADINYGN